MPHALPPEHPDSPASTFAPDQPARGVVADDVEDAPSGSEKAADATVKDAKRNASEGGEDTVKLAEKAAKEAKAAAKADAERAEARQPRQ